MEKNKVASFINKLSKETLCNIVYWNRLSNMQNVTEESNSAIFNLLAENEFHHIDYLDSYYAVINDGEVYIINETNESGRDCTVVSGYCMYVHKEGSLNVHNFPCSQSDIYRLLNAITTSLSKRENELESFIDSYLMYNK